MFNEQADQAIDIRKFWCNLVRINNYRQKNGNLDAPLYDNSELGNVTWKQNSLVNINIKLGAKIHLAISLLGWKLIMNLETSIST